MTNKNDINFGLTLSGGVARGLAHIGVLKALENANIRPDYLTGTSMGGVSTAVAALAPQFTPGEDIRWWSALLLIHLIMI